MVYEKSAKGLPPLRRTKLSKKTQEKKDEIQKKMYESNKWWNDCKFQLHWNKLEWVNPKISTKGINSIQLLKKTFYLNKNDRTAHWVGHSKLKELYINDLFKIKHMNE